MTLGRRKSFGKIQRFCYRPGNTETWNYWRMIRNLVWGSNNGGILCWGRFLVEGVCGCVGGSGIAYFLRGPICKHCVQLHARMTQLSQHCIFLFIATVSCIAVNQHCLFIARLSAKSQHCLFSQAFRSTDRIPFKLVGRSTWEMNLLNKEQPTNACHLKQEIPASCKYWI